MTEAIPVRLPERCPTCGASVISMFDHVDKDCDQWPDPVAWTITYSSPATSFVDLVLVVYAATRSKARAKAFEFWKTHITMSWRYMMAFSKVRRGDLS